MKNILLICSAGITSGFIVKEMQEATDEVFENVKVWSAGVADTREEVEKADIVLLSPPAAYLKTTFVELVSEGVPVKAVPTDLYAKADGLKIVEFALED